MAHVIAYPALVALVAIGKDFSSSLKNLFDSLSSMRDAAKNRGRKFDAWFIRVTADSEKEGVWLEAMHTENVLPMHWGRYNPTTVYHLFVDGDCVCNTQKKECDVSHWL